MKILVLTGDANTLVCHRSELIKQFTHHGLEVVCAAAGRTDYVEAFLEKIQVRFVPINLKRTGLNPLKDILAFLEIFRLIRRESPEYVFTYTIKSVVYGSVAAKMNGVPRIFSLVPGLGYPFTKDGTLKQKLIHHCAKALYRVALSCVDKVFLQNTDDEKLLRESNVLPETTKSYITPGSGVDLEEFPAKPLTASPAPGVSTFRFLLVSRLLKNKGIHQFAEAARRVRRVYPNAHFDLVGPFDPGPDGVSMKDVETWQAEGILEYHGMTRNVQGFLSRAHAFVLPTYYREGVPRSILEALSTGLPIITTDTVGSRETVDISTQCWNQRNGTTMVHCGSNGFLVPPKDVASLVEAMSYLLKDPERGLLMGQASRSLAEDRFDVRKVNAAILREIGFTESSPALRSELKAAA